MSVRWAAGGTESLNREYPTPDGTHLMITDTTTISQAVTLDTSAVMKAFRAFLVDIEHDRALERLMSFVIEHAGAENGMLFFPDGGTWIAKARHFSNEPSPIIDVLPEILLAYTARIQEPVVLRDASREGEFTRDNYIMTHQSKSVLCLPLMNQGRLVAILFLENRLAPGIFTLERLEVLTLLASQAAISIENVMLYANLEQRVQERTAELETEKEEALEAKQVAEAARKASDKANQAKSEFLSNMSHELRTPLNAILGYAHILKRDRSPVESEFAHLEIIERSGTLLLNLINELLDLSRIEAHKLELHEETFSLLGCLKSVVSMIEFRARDKGIGFEAVLDSHLPSSAIGDKHRLSQILLNLLGNAVKFTDSGGVTLEVTLVTDDLKSQISNLKFAISDTGPGIPKDRLEEIFSPFAQVGDHTRQRKGTGLGLAISRQLVQLMGGMLHVESEEGNGSCFWFDIPVTLPEEDKFSSVYVPVEQRIIGYKGERKSLLIVDDNVQNRTMLTSLLRPFGFLVHEATDGRDALKQLEAAPSHPPDLILLDLIMPVMNGFEFAHQLRSSPPFKQIKVIVVSANVSLLTEKKTMQKDYDDFLAKPLHVDALLACLAKHLSLEWVYGQTPGSTTHETPLIFPHQEDLETLLRAAKGGYITDIRDLLSQLKAASTDFWPFAESIDEMLQDFRFQQIIEFISSEMKR